MENGTIKKLADQDNFQLWKFQIVVAFKAKNVYDVVSGEEARPAAGEALAKWKVKDAKAQRLIVSTIERKTLIHILNCTTACGMFKKLCSIYERDSEQQKCLLTREFFSYKYDKSANISTNISNLENVASDSTH